MKEVKILFVIFVFSLSFSSFSQGSLYFVHLKAKDVKERSQIAKYIHIDNIIEDDVYATVNEHDLNAIKKFQADKLVKFHSLRFNQETALTSTTDYEFPTQDAAYHTYDEALEIIDNLSTQYPHLVEVSSLGTTVEGRDIPIIRITHDRNKAPNLFVPGILFVGSHHAREHLSTEIPLMLAQHFTANYASDPQIKRLIDTRDIYIVPILNIDGKLYDIKGGQYKMWRKNRSINGQSSSKGVDLNRNYSFGWGTGGSSKSPGSNVYMGPAPFSEPETLAVKNFIEATPNIRTFISYHTFSELILYPWGGSHDHVGGTDQQIFEKMAQDMSQWNSYKPQKASDLYVASGDTCDWAYGEHGIYCFTFELSPRTLWTGGFYPGTKAIAPTFQANIGPALYLAEYSDDPARVLGEGHLY